jgi:LysM repeat protein
MRYSSRLRRSSIRARSLGCVLFLFGMLVGMLGLLVLPPERTRAQTSDSESRYIVEAGDSLTAIAAKTGVSVADLVALNELAGPDVIMAGQTLRLTPPQTPPLAPPRSTPTSLPTSSYRVEPGDTLFSIAARSGSTVEQLLVDNGLTDADVLLVGQILVLPAATPDAPAPGSLLSTRSGTGIVLTPSAVRTPTATQATATSGLAAASPSGTATPTATVPRTSSPTRVTSPSPVRSPVPSPSEVVSGRGVTIEWRESPNFWPGRPNGEPIALVIHTAAGTLQGMDRWFSVPESQSSAHFGIGLDGRVHQYVALADRSWANGYTEDGNLWPGPADGNPNDLTVSIEMEDWLAGPQPPDVQYQAGVTVGRVVLARYPGIRYLITHRAIAPGSRANDPGPRWVATGRFAALARDLGLIAIP